MIGKCGRTRGKRIDGFYREGVLSTSRRGDDTNLIVVLVLS